MTDKELLYCLIAIILGFLVYDMMGNGFSVGGEACQTNPDDPLRGFSILGCNNYSDNCNKRYMFRKDGKFYNCGDDDASEKCALVESCDNKLEDYSNVKKMILEYTGDLQDQLEKLTCKILDYLKIEHNCGFSEGEECGECLFTLEDVTRDSDTFRKASSTSHFKQLGYEDIKIVYATISYLTNQLFEIQDKVNKATTENMFLTELPAINKDLGEYYGEFMKLAKGVGAKMGIKIETDQTAVDLNLGDSILGDGDKKPPNDSPPVDLNLGGSILGDGDKKPPKDSPPAGITHDELASVDSLNQVPEPSQIDICKKAIQSHISGQKVISESCNDGKFQIKGKGKLIGTMMSLTECPTTGPKRLPELKDEFYNSLCPIDGDGM